MSACETEQSFFPPPDSCLGRHAASLVRVSHTYLLRMHISQELRTGVSCVPHMLPPGRCGRDVKRDKAKAIRPAFSLFFCFFYNKHKM